MSQLTPAWHCRVSVGPSHTAHPQGSSEEVRDLSKQRLSHACCVLGSPLTASHVSLHDQAAKVTRHPHVHAMPSTEPVLSKQSPCCVTETHQVDGVGEPAPGPPPALPASGAPLSGAEPRWPAEGAAHASLTLSHVSPSKGSGTLTASTGWAWRTFTG